MEYTKTVYVGGEGEIVEKKSRFIAHVQKVSTEEEAIAFINQMKKTYYDARHNCYAYLIGRKGEIQKFSDDGEPSGTAGRPMLSVLEQEGIYDVAVVVTRYFGGVLLGTGGLLRAYQEATKEGIAASQICEKKAGVLLEMSFPYPTLGKLQYYCATNGIHVADTIYEENVTLRIIVENDMEKQIIADITNQTEGSVVPGKIKELEYLLVDGNVVLE